MSLNLRSRKSHQNYQDVTYSREEREAWDRYVAAMLGDDFSISSAGDFADEMLNERRKRFLASSDEPKEK